MYFCQRFPNSALLPLIRSSDHDTDPVLDDVAAHLPLAVCEQEETVLEFIELHGTVSPCVSEFLEGQEWILI